MSDGSNSDSEMNIISGDKSDKEDHDRVTVDTDSFERVRGQLGGSIAENAIPCELSQLSKWNSTNISVLMCAITLQNFNLT